MNNKITDFINITEKGEDILFEWPKENPVLSMGGPKERNLELMLKAFVDNINKYLIILAKEFKRDML